MVQADNSKPPQTEKAKPLDAGLLAGPTGLEPLVSGDLPALRAVTTNQTTWHQLGYLQVSPHPSETSTRQAWGRIGNIEATER